MILMAMVVAARRPDVPAARALVTFLALIGLTLTSGGGWLPDAGVYAVYAMRGPLRNLQPLAGTALRLHLPIRIERRPA